MWQRFTERARRVVFFAQEEAQRLGQSYVGTEHMLLGLVRESDSVAARILDRLGVPLERIRAEIERQVGQGHRNPSDDVQLTPRAKRVIDLAYEEARRLHNNYIGTEHLLLGLIREGDGLAGRVLVTLGADLERTRQEVDRMQEGDAQAKKQDAPRVHPDPAWQRLWDMPYAGLRKLAEIARGDRGPAGAASAAALAVDLTRSNCADLRHLRGIGDLSADQAWGLLSLARVLKDTLGQKKTAHREILAGKTLAMLFEKPSLRTRVSFETGMFQLGGHAVCLSHTDIGLKTRETVPDVAHNLERMVDGIVARVFSHDTIVELAANSRVPVINGLCDREHPCQALADFLTLWERFGRIDGLRIAYVGDGNNVAHSLMLLGARLGARVVLACPDGYHPSSGIVEAAREEAGRRGGWIAVTGDPKEACTGADAIYTDVWTSMGQEAESAERLKAFAGFQVDEPLCAVAAETHVFMHCLPAHRGEEVSAGVMDGPHSVVFEQAENRLHAQKAILAVLLG